MVLICKILNPLHSRMLCAKFGWNWSIGSGKEDFFNFVNLNVFSLYHSIYHLPLEKGVDLNFNKIETPSNKDVFYQIWLKLAKCFWRIRFLNFFNVNSLFRNYLPLTGPWPFISTNLNSLYSRILCAKFGWNWSSASVQDNFRYFLIIALVKGRGPLFK